MVRYCCVLLMLGGALLAQTPAAEKDPLGRTSPQASIVRFLEACHAKDYRKAAMFLDLKKLPTADRAKQGMELAEQLEDLLDDTSFEITTLSRDPEGDQADELTPGIDRLAEFAVDGKKLEFELEHVESRPGEKVWLVSADSVALIAEAHKLVAETPFEKKLPQVLVTSELLDTPVWRWIVLAVTGVVLWFGLGLAKLALSKLLQEATAKLLGPARLCIAAAGLRLMMEFAQPATLARAFFERLLALLIVLGLAGVAGVVVDLTSERWKAKLNPRVQAMSYSVLPLAKQVFKLGLYLIAILGIFSAWGYNISAILAGVGVGGLAVALAAQKTIENLFGGISVIGDRPVLVGDVCRFGDRTGTVMHIGLRSTRIRTSERTSVSIPNATFSSMELENISRRDKIWFHTTLNLRRDTTSEQLQTVLASVADILKSHAKVEIGAIPVRFTGVGPYSLDVEVDSYVATADGDEFLALRQELLFEMLQAVEKAGTGLAVPLQERVDRRGS